MPRQARIDFPGALHHIMVRGIDRCDIFKSDVDKEHFLDRLGVVLEESGTHCYAFALMTNHVFIFCSSQGSFLSVPGLILTALIPKL